MNQKEKNEQVRKRNNERYKSDKKYRVYQLNKTRTYRKAQSILTERHKEEFEDIIKELKTDVEEEE